MSDGTVLLAGISASIPWKRLQGQAETLKNYHLRDLLADDERCEALSATALGITLDYSREKLLVETVDSLFDLAEAAGGSRPHALGCFFK